MKRRVTNWHVYSLFYEVLLKAIMSFEEKIAKLVSKRYSYGH